MEDKNNTTKNTIDSIEDNGGVSSVCSNTDKPIPDTKLKKDRPQNKNLISLSSRTMEERQAIGRLGGIKSGETRRKKKSMKDSIIELLSQPLTEDLIKQYGLDSVVQKEGATFQDGILGAVLIGAMNGDTKSAQYIRDTAGEQPTIKTENHTELVTAEDLKTIDNLRKYLTG